MEKTTKENKVKKNVVSQEKTKTTSKSKKSSSFSKSNSNSNKSQLETNTKVTTKKRASKKATNRASDTKKTTTKPSTVKAKSKKKKTQAKTLDSSQRMKIDMVEYYDLPYRYNQTIVKLLFQTPKTLFVYWDITDSDRENYKKQYGENFFENTKPVLVVHNQTKHYTFELEINDFANSWYFHIPDPNCKYIIELGRRSKNQEVSIPNDYLYITSSNPLEAPNDKILFQPKDGKIMYKNAKTHQLSQKDFGSITFMNHLKHIYSISEFYHQIYEQEFLQEFKNHTMKNPTSGII